MTYARLLMITWLKMVIVETIPLPGTLYLDLRFCAFFDSVV